MNPFSFTLCLLLKAVGSCSNFRSRRIPSLWRGQTGGGEPRRWGPRGPREDGARRGACGPGRRARENTGRGPGANTPLNQGGPGPGPRGVCSPGLGPPAAARRGLLSRGSRP